MKVRKACGIAAHAGRGENHSSPLAPSLWLKEGQCYAVSPNTIFAVLSQVKSSRRIAREFTAHRPYFFVEGRSYHVLIETGAISALLPEPIQSYFGC